jgi:hypothetical protein
MRIIVFKHRDKEFGIMHALIDIHSREQAMSVGIIDISNILHKKGKTTKKRFQMLDRRIFLCSRISSNCSLCLTFDRVKYVQNKNGPPAHTLAIRKNDKCSQLFVL